jgi:integrase
VRWRTPDGRQPRRTFRTKRLADAFLHKTLTDIEEHGLVGTRRGDTVSSMFAEWWTGIEGRLRHDTVTTYARYRVIIEEGWGDTPLAKVDYAFVQRVVDTLSSEGYAATTVTAVYSILNLALTDAHLRGKIRVIPRPKMPRAEAPDLTIPTRVEVEQLADAIRLDLRAAVILAGYCGLRQGEVLGLERRNLRLDEGRVWIGQAANQKTGKGQATKTKASRRWVVLPDHAQAVLEWHLAEIAAPGDQDADGAGRSPAARGTDRIFPISASLLDKAWRDARERCGLGAVRFHDLRHAAASMMIAAGCSIMHVQRQLGHARPSMTLDTYGFLYPTSVEDALTKINAYLAQDATAGSNT